jgi:signal transduction histidine kinase
MATQHWYLVVPSLFAVLGHIALLTVVSCHGIRSRLRRYASLYLLALAIWSFGSLMMRLDPTRILFWNKILVAGGVIVMPWALLCFTRAYLGLPQDRWLWLALVVPGFLAIATATGHMVDYVRLTDSGRIEFGFDRALPIYATYWIFSLGYTCWALVRAYRHSVDPVMRNRIRYPLIGITFVFLGGLTNVSPAIAAFPVDHAANFINALLLTYAILRHRLLDISIIIRKGLLYSVPTAALAIVYLLIVLATERLLVSFVGYQLLFLSTLVAAITAVAVQPLRDRVQLFIDKLFFREKYDAQLMLKELSELAGSILDIEELSSLLLDRLTAALHIKRAYIMLKEETAAQFHIIARNSQAQPGDDITLHGSHPIVEWMSNHRQPLSRSELDFLPQFKALWAQERESLNRLEAELFIPLLVRDELIGILILGVRLSEASYSRDEQLTLTTLANQTAVAIQNARLYSDLERSLETLQQMQDQLVQSEKLSAIGEMIAGVAHEINNPLTAVIGYSQLLQMQSMDQDAQIHDDLGQILEAGMRMKRIVANLLDFSRQHQPQKEYVDINQIISTSLALRMNELTNNNIEVEADLVTDLPWTMADRHQLQQVFVNIINNAQQAMAEQGGAGRLTVSTEQQTNNAILISFQDTGPGMPEETMNRIFDPFFTTKEVGKGTGLGLSVSYGIVHEHDGRIWAESEDGHGATFLIQLPIRKSAEPTTTQDSLMPALVGDRVR